MRLRAGRLDDEWTVTRLGVCVGLGVLVVACGSDLVAPKPAPDPSRLYWALALDHRAVNLSTAPAYRTLQLTATPRAASGTVLPQSGSVVFASTNAAYVQVSPTGLLNGVAPGTQTLVTATLTLGAVTHADTAVVNVTADTAPPVLATFSIHPIPPDSAKRGATLFPYPWPVYAADTSGTPIPNLAVACTSSDPTIARVDPSCGLIFAYGPGHAVITASTTAYGVTKADSLSFTVGQWLLAAVFITQGAGTLRDATIGATGSVYWLNQTSQPIDITFSDTSNVANITALPAGGTTVRAFPVLGTFVYQSAAAQASGRILVVSN